MEGEVVGEVEGEATGVVRGMKERYRRRVWGWMRMLLLGTGEGREGRKGEGGVLVRDYWMQVKRVRWLLGWMGQVVGMQELFGVRFVRYLRVMKLLLRIMLRGILIELSLLCAAFLGISRVVVDMIRRIFRGSYRMVPGYQNFATKYHYIQPD